MLQQIRSLIGMFQLGMHSQQMFVCFRQCALPIVRDRALDDLVAQSAKAPARIRGGVDHARQAQAIQVALREQPVTGGATLDRRNQAPVHVAADRIGVDAHGAGQIRGAQEFGCHRRYNLTQRKRAL